MPSCRAAAHRIGGVLEFICNRRDVVRFQFNRPHTTVTSLGFTFFVVMLLNSDAGSRGVDRSGPYLSAGSVAGALGAARSSLLRSDRQELSCGPRRRTSPNRGHYGIFAPVPLLVALHTPPAHPAKRTCTIGWNGGSISRSRGHPRSQRDPGVPRLSMHPNRRLPGERLQRRRAS